MEHLAKEVAKMFSVYKNRWTFIGISITLILVGIMFVSINGFQLDIDFAGGTSITFDATQKVEQTEVADLVYETLGFPASAVQVNAQNPNEFTVKTKAIDEDASQRLLQAFKTKYQLEDDHSDFLVNSFTPSFGRQMANQALLAVGIAVILMLVYITVRFEFLFGVSAVIALIHDVLIMISVYAIFRVPVNTSFIAVVLTTLGYSINNTIIVFDRIRENRKNADAKESLEKIADKSFFQTLGRSVNTTVTTFVMVGVLYVMGVNSIKEFALPLMIGILAGAYSSLFIASPVWVMMKKNKTSK